MGWVLEEDAERIEWGAEKGSFFLSITKESTSSELGVEGEGSQLPGIYPAIPSSKPTHPALSRDGVGSVYLLRSTHKGQAGAALGNRRQGSWAVLGSQAAVSHLGFDANEAWPHAESRSGCTRGGEPSLGGVMS